MFHRTTLFLLSSMARASACCVRKQLTERGPPTANAEAASRAALAQNVLDAQVVSEIAGPDSSPSGVLFDSCSLAACIRTCSLLLYRRAADKYCHCVLLRTPRPRPIRPRGVQGLTFTQSLATSGSKAKFSPRKELDKAFGPVSNAVTRRPWI